MYARIATFEGARPEDIETVRRLDREEFGPRLRELQGYAGHLSLGDIETARGLGIVLFDSQEALDAGDQALNAMSPPDELEATRRTSVERFEVAFHEFSGEPEAARLSRLEGSPDKIDEGVEFAKSNVLPRARNVDGWDGIFVLVDRQTGKTVILTLWESTDALRASEEEANRLRQESADAFAERITGVERYEVAVAEVLVRAGSR